MTGVGMAFGDFFEQATGRSPYPWQVGIAEQGLPEAIDIETGAGKTAGVVLGWLHRLLQHPEDQVRRETPSWLVVALPMRSLVDQTETAINTWLGNLGGSGGGTTCHRLLGGEGRVDGDWRERPGQPTVIVGTVDMLISRALMRGYGSSRWVWPIEYGVLHSGAHWVFDEVQLLGPALATGRQLEAFRTMFGTAAPCGSTWMSATLHLDRLRTVDNQAVAPPVVLTDADRTQGLAKRLDGTRTISELPSSTEAELAKAVLREHQPGTLTLVVVNLVKRAQKLFSSLEREARRDGPDVHLLHSRYRPADRATIIDAAITNPVDPAGPGRVLVATQVVEAGIDISARTLVTDVAPWSSIVQRAGRCNRAGEFDDAQLFWVRPSSPAPYEQADLDATSGALGDLEGEAVTSTDLRERGQEVDETEAIVPVLRRRDLLDLFDTSPDLIGNDIDVGRFIRADDDTDVQVAWRERATQASPSQPFVGGPIRAEELCRISVGDARRWLGSVTAWTPDHLGGRRRWKRLEPFAVRAGVVVVVDASDGGYTSVNGWNGSTRGAVPVIPTAETDLQLAPIDEATADDPASFIWSWVTLDDHLGDTQRAAKDLLDEVPTPDLGRAAANTVLRAAALHDVGKVHEVFQSTLLRSADDSARDRAEHLCPLAKSGGTSRARHSRPHFRHELVSALLLDANEQALLHDVDGEADLVRYLVAAHHGRVRMSIRSVPGETPPSDMAGRRVALGVVDGEVVDGFATGGTDVPPTTLSLDAMRLGGEGSWTAMALRLRDRHDLGPFRLATLEALVRLADWRASARPTISALPDDPAGDELDGASA